MKLKLVAKEWLSKKEEGYGGALYAIFGETNGTFKSFNEKLSDYMRTVKEVEKEVDEAQIQDYSVGGGKKVRVVRVDDDLSVVKDLQPPVATPRKMRFDDALAGLLVLSSVVDKPTLLKEKDPTEAAYSLFMDSATFMYTVAASSGALLPMIAGVMVATDIGILLIDLYNLTHDPANTKNVFLEYKALRGLFGSEDASGLGAKVGDLLNLHTDTPAILPRLYKRLARASESVSLLPPRSVRMEKSDVNTVNVRNRNTVELPGTDLLAQLSISSAMRHRIDTFLSEVVRTPDMSKASVEEIRPFPVPSPQAPWAPKESAPRVETRGVFRDKKEVSLPVQSPPSPPARQTPKESLLVQTPFAPLAKTMIEALPAASVAASVLRANAVRETPKEVERLAMRALPKAEAELALTEEEIARIREECCEPCRCTQPRKKPIFLPKFPVPVPDLSLPPHFGILLSLFSVAMIALGKASALSEDFLVEIGVLPRFSRVI